jgi:predicted transposase YdaD
MPYITSVEQIGFDRGVEQGIDRGIEQGKRSLILRLLARQVGELPPAFQTQVEALPLAQLEALGDALLNFTGLADLEQWLATIPR